MLGEVCFFMSTAKLFDQLFERYDEWFKRNRITAENEIRLIKTILSEHQRSSIEVGIGTGFFASKIGIEVGLDPSFNMLKVAKKRSMKLLAIGVGENMPFRDESFGTVLIVVTLCFVDDPLAVIRESWRILKVGGILVTCIVPRDSPWGDHYIKLGTSGHPFYSKAKFYTVSEVVSMIENTSFKIVDIKGTLSYKPHEKHRLETPSNDIKDRGFICIKAIKKR